ncbi:MAG: peptidoglycan-associated lipoprotein Pal [Kiritimatiellae bacterium]|nr:peptidoglycan-associated lipoprotein Pal [Kiritimatiellia bacterium]MDW8458566.1 peptidoglycan-associated lipoprotein Pal [Verrucomicrobiota bacterium]
MKTWLKVGMLLTLAAAVSLTGCKKKPKAGAGAAGGIDDVGGVIGSDVSGEGLGLRPEGLAEIASQFGVVYFDFDSAQINPSERGKIEAVADYLRRNPSVGVIVEGHCDERGSNEYNLALGERRAMAVRAYLVSLGIDAARIQTKSYGEERPVALGHDEASWAQNRRAEFKLFQ